MRKTFQRLATLAFFAAFSHAANATGFEIREHSASVAGNATAGAAAIAEDASTIFYNPAGMTYLEGHQFSAGSPIIFSISDFDNQGTVDGVGGPVTGKSSIDNDQLFGPSLFGMISLTERLKLGLGINSPFGQGTEYDSDWVGRYHNIETKLFTLNVNPSGAYQVTDWLSLGVGFNAQYAKAERTDAIDFGTICFITPGLGPGACPALGLTPQGADGRFDVEAEDWGFGYNFGVIVAPFEGTRLGFAYRSALDFTLEGDAEFRVPATAAVLTGGGLLFSDTGASLDATFPETASLSVYQEMFDGLSFLGDITWTRWSRSETLRIEFDNPSQPDIVERQNWDNTFRFSFGLNYQPDPDLKLRTGFSYDQSPIPDEFRNVALPGEDRFSFALGGTYRLEDWFWIDAGYVFSWQKDATVLRATPTAGTISGTFENKAHALGLQVNLRF